MPKRKVEVNEFTYGALLEACIKNKDMKRGKDIQERMMKDKRITLNTILYSTVLKMLNLDRKLKQSKLVFNTMCEKKETQPNNFTYNTLIDTANKCGDLDWAEELFVRMKNEGHRRDLITYGSMIKGLAKARKQSAQGNYLRMMMEDGLKVDEMFVRTLFNNRNEQVYAAMDELRKNY